VGFGVVSPFLLEKLSLHDTCGVHNLHGMPGVLAGIIGAIGAAAASGTYGDENYKNHAALVSAFPLRFDYVNGTVVEVRSAGTQAAYQMGFLGLTLVFSILSGLATGFICKFVEPAELYYDDKEHFEVPEDVEEGIPLVDQNPFDELARFPRGRPASRRTSWRIPHEVDEQDDMEVEVNRLTEKAVVDSKLTGAGGNPTKLPPIAPGKWPHEEKEKEKGKEREDKAGEGVGVSPLPPMSQPPAEPSAAEPSEPTPAPAEATNMAPEP